MSIELESLLPNAKYIVKWRKTILGDTGHLQFSLKLSLPLEIEIKNSDNLKELLIKYKIPIDTIHSTFWYPGVSYSGYSEETGHYALTSRNNSLLMWADQEVISLKVSKKGKDANKAADLLKAIKEYVSLHEQEE